MVQESHTLDSPQGRTTRLRQSKLLSFHCIVDEAAPCHNPYGADSRDDNHEHCESINRHDLSRHRAR